MTDVLAPPRWRQRFTRVALVATAATVALAGTASSAVAATTSDGFNPAGPNRVIDTRIDMPDRPAGKAQGFLQAQLPDSVPNGASALLSVTVVVPDSGGYITAYPDGDDVPETSDVNWVAGNTVAESVVVPASSKSNGKIDFVVDSGADGVDVIVDVIGSFAGSTYASLAPAQRVYDSRTGDDAGLREEGVYAVTLPPASEDGGIPDDAQAVAITLGQTNATGTGYVAAMSNADDAGTSSVNYDAGTVRSNLVFVKPTDGKIYLRVVGAPTDLFVDVKGYTESTAVTAVAPERALDSRQSADGGLFAPGTTVAIQLPATAPTGADFALLNVTATEATSAGYLASYRAADGQMQTSNLNWVPGPNVAGFVLAPVVDGRAQVYIGAGSTKLVADVEGYVVNAD